jgi:hypothetical protein
MSRPCQPLGGIFAGGRPKAELHRDSHHESGAVQVRYTRPCSRRGVHIGGRGPSFMLSHYARSSIGSVDLRATH